MSRRRVGWCMQRLEQDIILAEPVLVRSGQDNAQGADRFQMTVRVKEVNR